MRELVSALLFDLGGVLIRIDFERAFERWARQSGTSAARLAARFRMDESYRRLERGEIAVEAYFRSLRASLEVELSDAELLEGWNAIFLEPSPGMEELLAAAAERAPLYVLSNTNRAHHGEWAARYADLLAPFRGVFSSFELGARKPDAAAFGRACERMGVEPGQVLFFDDTAENVAGARSFGLQAFTVSSAGEVAAIMDGRWPESGARGASEGGGL